MNQVIACWYSRVCGDAAGPNRLFNCGVANWSPMSNLDVDQREEIFGA
jgi:hypothetical protein